MAFVVNTFKPIFSNDCELLILGTLPSEESRKNNEYYYNKTNKFWEMICEYLGVKIPTNYNDKVKLLLNNQIGLWDIIETCDIVGSKNDTITNPTFNDINSLIGCSNVKLILVNGIDVYKKYSKTFNELSVPVMPMQNTSNANNGNFNQELWEKALSILK